MARPTRVNRQYHLSDEAFAILTEAIRLKSNSIKKFASIQTVIEHIIEKLENYQFSDIHFLDFVSAVAVKGGNATYLQFQTCFNERLSVLQAKLSEICGIEVYDRTAIVYFVQLGIDEKLY